MKWGHGRFWKPSLILETRAHIIIYVYIYITVYIFIPADFPFLYFLYRFCPAIIDLAKWGKKNSSMVAFMMPTSCKSTPTPSHFARWRSGVNGLWPLWVVRQFGAHRLFPALLSLVRASCESVPVATPRNKIWQLPGHFDTRDLQPCRIRGCM